MPPKKTLLADSRETPLDALILCGGLGKRLQSVTGGRQKVMVEFQGRPFLELLLDFLRCQGISRFILLAGHESNRVRNHFKNTSYDVVFSVEAKPLGTGGALRNAASLITSDNFLLLNGDSFCFFDLDLFLKFHQQRRALISLILASSPEEDDYGVVDLDKDSSIVGFTEKAARSPNSYVNAGIYLMNRDVLDLLPNKEVFSLEYEVFPGLVGCNLHGFIVPQRVLDIGTPTRLEQARRLNLRGR